MTYASLAVFGLSYAISAQADYAFTSIDYPGVAYSNGGLTEVSGINSKGEVVGTALIDGGSSPIPFVYNYKTNRWIILPSFQSASSEAVGINESSVVVGVESNDGFATGSGFILDKGAFTIFSRLQSPYTEARGISSTGLVTGDAYNGRNATYTGFIYDPQRNTYIDFLPSTFTITQGINRGGDVVGSVRNAAGQETGFLRRQSGNITLFSVNGSQQTQARGITDSGSITGNYVDGSGIARGFVITLAKKQRFQALIVPRRDLLNFPNSTETRPEGILSEGTIVGIWSDNSGAPHGFIATPLNK
jgi:hypothetical protein